MKGGQFFWGKIKDFHSSTFSIPIPATFRNNGSGTNLKVEVQLICKRSKQKKF